MWQDKGEVYGRLITKRSPLSYSALFITQEKRAFLDMNQIQEKNIHFFTRLLCVARFVHTNPHAITFYNTPHLRYN